VGKGTISFNCLRVRADKVGTPGNRVMNPLHLFRLQLARNERERSPHSSSARPLHDGNKPIFRAPALPTSNQLNNELPFTVNFRPRLRERT
jgi:hypothetical protein